MTMIIAAAIWVALVPIAWILEYDLMGTPASYRFMALSFLWAPPLVLIVLICAFGHYLIGAFTKVPQ